MECRFAQIESASEYGSITPIASRASEENVGLMEKIVDIVLDTVLHVISRNDYTIDIYVRRYSFPVRHHFTFSASGRVSNCIGGVGRSECRSIVSLIEGCLLYTSDAADDNVSV